MQTTLSTSQLKRIEAQVTAHGGSQYLELHLEFCDHLSTAIETAWASGSKQSFEVLLAQEIRKFGYAGFRVLSKNREIDFNQKYKQQAWDLFKDWWTWPKMLFSLAVIALIYGLFSSIHNENVRFGLYGLLAFSGYFYVIPLFYKHFMAMKKQPIKVLAMRMLSDHLITYLTLFMIFLNFTKGGYVLESSWGISLYAFGQVSFWILTFYITPIMFRESWTIEERMTMIMD